LTPVGELPRRCRVVPVDVDDHGLPLLLNQQRV
jgi:hypothetical protein